MYTEGYFKLIELRILILNLLVFNLNIIYSLLLFINVHCLI